MASIGSLGVGSGLDLNGLLDKMAAAERVPLSALRTRQSAYNAKISAYGAVKGLLESFKTAAGKLADPSFMTGMKSSSSAADVLTVSSDSTAVAGTYSVNVTQLAQSQSLVSSGVASASSDIGAGSAATITIDFGAIAGTLNTTTGTYDPGATFTQDAARTSISVPLASGATSLEEVRDAINKAAADAVSASIINDGTSNRLVLASTATGANASMRIGVAGNSELAALLGNDPAGTQALRQTMQARDAALTVNGIAVSSRTNTVDGAMQGVKMTLVATGSSSVKVERDSGAVQAAINDFVAAYNKLDAKVKDLTGYDADKKAGGSLVGDSTLRIIQSRLRSTLFEVIPGAATGNPSVLSDLGISVTKEGSLEVKSDKLAAAMKDKAEGVAYLFAGAADTPGLADRFSSIVEAVTQDKSGETDDGILTTSVNGAKKAIEQLDEDYDTMDEHIQAKLDIYRAQFRQLDSIMSSMNATSSYLTQMFAKQTTK